MDEVKVTPKADKAVVDSRLPAPSISLEIAPLKNFLSVGEDPKEIGELKYIRSLFGKDVSDLEILHEVREVERKLGVPRLGETRLGKLYNYFRAMQNVKQAQKIRDGLLA